MHRGCFVDRLADAQIRAASAQIAIHRRVYVLVGRVRVRTEQGGSRHNLAGLTVATLRNVNLAPSLLQGMRAIGRKAFDGGDVRVLRTPDGCQAGAHGFAAKMYRTGAALANATAVFGSVEIEDIAKN